MAKDDDDLEPRHKPKVLKDLDVMSIEALREYIGELEAEIARAQAKIAAKEKAKLGAQGFFKS